ncbi:MAG: histidine phosphatase family protein [Hoeflea sp.]|nr:histidine phosphatase family protein [Hoeflea sp.]
MRLAAFCILFLLPGLALANDWDALEQPGAMAIMRHALAPGTGDPSEFRLGDCATQRNLDERGREQARRIGEAFRARGIAFEQVLSSQWCRTRETADLLDLGPVSDAPSLNSFFQDFATREQQTRETRALIGSAEGRLMLVTHQVNISALTGRGTRSGEVLIIRETDGEIEILGSILIDP